MKIHCSENELTSKAWEGESSCPRATLQWQARARSCWYISPLMLFSGSPSCICANGVRVDVRISMGRILVPKTTRGLQWRRLFLERRSVVATCPGSTVRTTSWEKLTRTRPSIMRFSILRCRRQVLFHLTWSLCATTADAAVPGVRFDGALGSRWST